ncbi:potassium channel family protein, partial [Paraburkholderia dipogonis]
TVGYGGITPHGHATRSLAILEALIGQLYLTIVLARLVSLHVAGNRPDTNRP